MIFNCDDCMATVFIFYCLKLLVICCASSTTRPMCLVMPNIVCCISLYLSVFLCLCLPDWRINVFIVSRMLAVLGHCISFSLKHRV